MPSLARLDALVRPVLRFLWRESLPLLRRLHGNQKHIGKIPARVGSHVRLKKDIERLREELQKKVAEEAFEEAAVLRDKIRKLENKISSGGENHGG